MNEEILKLAKACSGFNSMEDFVLTFYRAAFNQGVMAASRVSYGMGDEDTCRQVRELLK